MMNEKLSRRDYRDMYKMYETHVRIAVIARRFNISYSLAHYHLRKKGLITKVKLYRKKDSEYHFDYKDYLDTLLEKCRQIQNMNKTEFKRFLKTDIGENMIIQESVYYTPSIHTMIKKKKEDE